MLGVLAGVQLGLAVEPVSLRVFAGRLVLPVVTIALAWSRGGDLVALTEPARTCWARLAEHSDLHAAQATIPALSPHVWTQITTDLLERQMLVAATAPRPWPAPRPAPAASPSFGARNGAAVLSPLAQPPRGDRIAGTVALLLVAVFRRVLRLKRLIRLVRVLHRLGPLPATSSQTAAAVAAVSWAALRLPGRLACLERSLAVAVLLARRRCHATWCLGVASSPVRVHAWNAVAGQPIGEPPETSQYAPLLQLDGTGER